MKKTISVRYAMTRNPILVNPLQTVEDCAKKMIQEGVGSLIIEENGRLKGIVTEKDIVQKVVAFSLDAKKMPVNKIMTPNPTVIDPEKDLMEAIKIMNEKHLRRLPVVKDNKLIGLLTIRDVLKIQPELFDLINERAKVYSSEMAANEGECELCGNYTVLRKKKNKMICNECN